MKVAHFTAGTVGAGHLAHAVAIRRGLERAGFAGEFRVFGPPIDFPAAERFGYNAIPIDPHQVTNPFEAPETELARALTTYAPDLLLVEMFWAPVMYLLPLQHCEHWLLVRKARSNWLEGNEYAPFDGSLYQRIIAFEPVDHQLFTHRLEPIVICNPDECKPPTALRERVGVPHGRQLVVVMHAGTAGEIDRIATSDLGGEKPFVVRLDLHDRQQTLFPAAEWLPGADAIYAAAGYNSFWEAKWLGYYDRTTFTAFDREIDDQQWRIDTCADYVQRENGADQLARWIVG